MNRGHILKNYELKPGYLNNLFSYLSLYLFILLHKDA